MESNLPFYFYRTFARAFGSIFFPLFSGWGENDLKPGKGQIVFARNSGLVTLLNSLRFFVCPISVIVRNSESQSIAWKLAEAGGLKIYRLSDNADFEESYALINSVLEQKEVPLYLISECKFETDDLLIRKFSESVSLFFAVSGCKKVLTFGLIPAVTEMKAICASLPVYGEERERFKGISSLLFLEKSLKMTPQFEVPTFFHTHSKFSSN